MIIEGNIVDVFKKNIFQGKIYIEGSKIVKIEQCNILSTYYILPGLIDSHVHIESSMLTPSRFAELVVPRGTVAVVSDPHEIANVNGVEGVEFMMKDAEKVPLKCYFGAPSCVPATPFESAGAEISVNEIEDLFKKGASFLAEMMNFPGVINDDPSVMAKLKLAKKYNKPVDGHAPGLDYDALKKYTDAGITTDHECSTLKEAKDKIDLGMMIQIREGSAARNFDALYDLLNTNPEQTMICTDDSHPDLIIEKGHIDRLIKLGLSKGISLFNLYQAAVINPIDHYKLDVGLLQEGDNADFIIVDNLSDFNVLATYIDGEKVAEDGKKCFDFMPSELINNFNCDPILLENLEIIAKKDSPKVRVMEVLDGELLTNASFWETKIEINKPVIALPQEDILKIVVVNRYKNAPPSVGFVRNFGLKEGALASSVAHDSHNIVAVGCDDDELVKAINAVISQKGGIAVSNTEEINVLPLPVAGLMSNCSGHEVAAKYDEINRVVNAMGCRMKAPFMTLAFMSLLVIPSLKIGDKGLFDVNKFSFTSLFVDDE